MKNISIIGQGLAGTLLAFEFLKRGITVCIYNTDLEKSASWVASGIVNPITLRNMVTTFMAEELLPVANETYTNLEKLLDASFYIPKKILRKIGSDNEQKLWQEKKRFPFFNNHLHYPVNPVHGVVSSKYGYGEIYNTYYLNTEMFLKKAEQYFINNGLLKHQFVHDNDLEFGDNLAIKGNRTDAIVVCNGSFLHNNNLFGYLPLKPAKGELLTLKIEELSQEYCYNFGRFLLPIGNSQFTLGSTFEWKDLSLHTTEKAANELIAKLNEFITLPYEIVSQKAGIRPASSDRRPLVGAHNKHDKIYVFNGLGTRGVMLAPYFATHLVDHILNGKSLIPEVDVKRCSKKNSK